MARGPDIPSRITSKRPPSKAPAAPPPRRPAPPAEVPMEPLSNAAGSLRMADDGGVIIDEPRNSPTGETNAQRLIKIAFRQSKSSRSTPTRRVGSGGSWVSGKPEEVPNDRVRAILEMMSGGHEYRQLARRAFAEMPGDEQMHLLTILANELPNPKPENGWSPQAKAVVDFLLGKPSNVSAKSLGEEFGSPRPDIGYRTNVEFIDDRANAVDALRPLEDFGLKTERGSAGREATQDFAFDDSPVLDTAPMPSSEAAPGDLAFVTKGYQAPAAKTPPTMINKAEGRPGLRGMDYEYHIGRDNDGNPYPVRVLKPKAKGSDDQTPHFGDVDYGNVQKGVAWEGALEANADRVRAEISRKYGSERQFASMVQEAVQKSRSNDPRIASEGKEELGPLLDDYNQIRDSIERQRVPGKPYPVNKDKALASLTPKKDSLTSATERLARGDIGAADTVWDMVRKAKKGPETLHSPSSPGSGIETPEQFADILLSSPFFHSDRLPPREAFGRFRQQIVDKLRDRFWTPGAQNPVDPEATVITETGNPATLAEQQKRVRLGSDPEPRSKMLPAEREVFDEATRPVDRPKGFRGKEDPGLEGFGKPKVDPENIPGAKSPEELAEQSKQALRNWALDRTAAGKVVYRDPKTGGLVAQFVTGQMKKATVAKIRSLAAQLYASTPDGAARFGELWPEGQLPSPGFFKTLVDRANNAAAYRAQEGKFRRLPWQLDEGQELSSPQSDRDMSVSGLPTLGRQTATPPTVGDSTSAPRPYWDAGVNRPGLGSQTATPPTVGDESSAPLPNWQAGSVAVVPIKPGLGFDTGKFKGQIESMDTQSLRKLSDDLDAERNDIPEGRTKAEDSVLRDIHHQRMMISLELSRRGDAESVGGKAEGGRRLRIPPGQTPTKWGDDASPTEAAAADLERARQEWAQVTGKIVEKPPGFIKRPDGSIARTAYLTPEEYEAAWRAEGGIGYPRGSDVPYPGSAVPDIKQRLAEMESRQARDMANAEANDPGPGEGYDGPEYEGPGVGESDAPVVGTSAAPSTPRQAGDDLLDEIIKVIDDDSATPEDLAWARSQRDEARARHDAEQDEEVRAEFRKTVLDPINAAAARRQARANPTPATTPDVESNLDAAATPIEPESLPGSSTPAPVDETPDVQANRNADAQKAASDAEGENADIESKADADNAAQNNGTTTPADPPAPTKDPRWFPGTRDHLWGNKGRYAIGAGVTGAGLLAYNQAVSTPPYAPGQQPFSSGPGEMDSPMTPEDRIRQVIQQRMQKELIPHTSQRYY